MLEASGIATDDYLLYSFQYHDSYTHGSCSQYHQAELQIDLCLAEDWLCRDRFGYFIGTFVFHLKKKIIYL